MGFSDHLLQVVKIYIAKENRRDKIVLRRQLTNNNNNNIEESKNSCLLKLNMYFMNNVAELVQQNINQGSYNNSRQEINHCSNSICISPVTEVVVSLAKNLKDKPIAGYDDIPESLVKQCIQLIKGPLVHIYNVSLRSGVFPDE